MQHFSEPYTSYISPAYPYGDLIGTLYGIISLLSGPYLSNILSEPYPVCSIPYRDLIRTLSGPYQDDINPYQDPYRDLIWSLIGTLSVLNLRFT